MRLASPSFKQGGTIPRKYTCQGIDINPPLEIEEIPQEAKSLALIVEDPDVPKKLRADGLWVHWVVYDIEPSHSSIVEGVSSLGIIGRNTDGKNEYMGPCPPDREHRYFLQIICP